MRLGAGAPAGAKALLSHNLDGELQFRLVSRAVNSVRNQGAECDAEPLTIRPSGSSFGNRSFGKPVPSLARLISV